MKAVDRGEIALNTIATLAGIYPVIWLATGFVAGDLGPNPPETMLHVTGQWALNFLLISLAASLARRLTAIPHINELPRVFGFLSAIYAGLHLFVFVFFEHFFDFAAIGRDIVKRPYITLGMLAFVLICAAFAASVRPISGRIAPVTKMLLLRLAYLAAIAGVLHFLMLVKADGRRPLIYTGILGVIVVIRMLHVKGTKKRREEEPDTPPRPEPEKTVGP